MTGRRKHKKPHSSSSTYRNSRDILTSIKDVTIAEYANADKSTHLKKCNTIATDAVGEDDHEESGIQETGGRGGRRRRRWGGEGEATGGGRLYPEVLFHLVSQFVSPEDVGRFAAVNHAAYSATRHTSFWLRLYSRHCSTAARSLPSRLRVSVATHRYALRYRVVCALHRLYPPFLARRGTPVSLSACEGRRCVSMWYETQPDGACLYYFKLKERWSTSRAPLPPGPHLLDRLCDVHANPDADCLVLLVKCARVEVVCEPPLGLVVRAVRGGGGGAADGCRLRRLQIELTGTSETTLVLHTVQETAVLHWWQAGFPPPPPPPRATPQDTPLYTDFLQHDVFS